MTSCPDAHTWTERLRAAPEAALTDPHLASCPTCAALVGRLNLLPAIDDLSLEPPPNLPVVAWWDSPPAAPPGRGQLWMTAPDFDHSSAGYEGLKRLLVVLLGEPTSEFGLDWVQAIPLDSDVEAVTEYDIEVEPDETELDCPLRMRLDLRATLAVGQLMRPVGSLTAKGTGLLDRLETGQLERSRRGGPLHGPRDWRLEIGAEDSRSVARLQEVYAIVEAEACPETEEAEGWRAAWSESITIRMRLLDEIGRLFPPPGAARAAFRTAWQRLNDAVPDLYGGAIAHPAAFSAQGSPAPYWPLSSESHPSAEARLDTVEDRLVLTISGLPEEIEGLRPLIALIYAAGASDPHFSWWNGVPGLLIADDSVAGGRLRATLATPAAVDLRLSPTQIEAFAILPPPAADQGD